MGGILKGIKEYLIRSKVIRSQTEIEEYETTCYSCKKKFPKEKLRASLPIGLYTMRVLLCLECWKKDRNYKMLCIFIFVIIIVVFFIISPYLLGIK